MESTSLPGRAQCTRPFADLAARQDPAVRLERRGLVDVKGRGPMETFWILDAPDSDGRPMSESEPSPGSGLSRRGLAHDAADSDDTDEARLGCDSRSRPEA